MITFYYYYYITCDISIIFNVREKCLQILMRIPWLITQVFVKTFWYVCGLPLGICFDSIIILLVLHHCVLWMTMFDLLVQVIYMKVRHIHAILQLDIHDVLSTDIHKTWLRRKGVLSVDLHTTWLRRKGVLSIDLYINFNISKVKKYREYMSN